ncbi:MAG: hypothetical protein LBV00_09460 [Propionibacteriaceae bacterium]|nr:hypothetical protein [Propionibacteriaceae bacterium]
MGLTLVPYRGSASIPSVAGGPTRLCGQAHVSSIGWQTTKCPKFTDLNSTTPAGASIGTEGRGLRMEAVKLWFERA